MSAPARSAAPPRDASASPEDASAPSSSHQRPPPAKPRGILRTSSFTRPRVDSPRGTAGVGLATRAMDIPPPSAVGGSRSAALSEASKSDDDSASDPGGFLASRVLAANHQGSVSAASRHALLASAVRHEFAEVDPYGDEADYVDSDDEESNDARGDEARVRRGAALTGLESPLQRAMQETARRDAAAAAAAVAAPAPHPRGAGSLDLIDELSQSDVTPLATPEVSKHGTNEAWLFLGKRGVFQGGGKGGSPERRSSGGGGGDAQDSPREGGEGGAGFVADADASARSSTRSSLRRSASVVSFDAASNRVHDIGSMKDLKREKKAAAREAAAKRGMLASLRADVYEMMVNYGLKGTKAKEKRVLEGLKESRSNMLVNIDDTSARNGDRSAWETRDISLRGGNAFGGVGRRRSVSSPTLGKV
jgi:hypothetical protein